MRKAALLLAAFVVSAVRSAVADGIGAQTVTASDELADAIKNLKALHMNSSKADWPTLEARAQGVIAGKQNPSDAYPAIYAIIVALGEKHTHLVPADAVKAMSRGKQVGQSRPAPVVPPEGYVLENKIGLLKLPFSWAATKDADARYTKASQDVLSQFARSHVCRFIIDLRGNTGGSMAPMINGVASLLGPGPYGHWVDPKGIEVAWTRENSLVEEPVSMESQTPPLRPNAPVALLLDGRTASAGEDTAISFEGRARTKSFGEPTAGYVTSNLTHTLPDGAMLAISTGWLSDRLHRPYKDRVIPDEATDPGQPTLDGAIAWLKQQPCDGSK